MTQSKITRTLLRDLVLPDGKAKVRVFDGQLTGFIAEKRASGVTFYVRYTDQKRRGREIKLGRLGVITCEQARARAQELRASISLGSDPIAERDRRRGVPTLKAFAEDTYLPYIKERLRSYVTVESHFRLRIIPILGRKAMDEITRVDILDLRRRLLDEGKLSGASINRTLAAIRGLFSAAIKWDVLTGRNPAVAGGNFLPEQHRDSFLTIPETKALVRALDSEPARDAAAAIVLLLLTGARKSEILSATWDNVEFDAGRLKIPRSKTGLRYIPLSPQAVAVLRGEAAKAKVGARFVFPGRKPGTPLAGIRVPWERAKRAAGLPADFRIHDLRHSFASTLVNSGRQLSEVGAILGHRQLSTTQRYAHHSQQRLIDTASIAAEAWGFLLEAPVAPAA
jgi:integrase